MKKVLLLVLTLALMLIVLCMLGIAQAQSPAPCYTVALVNISSSATPGQMASVNRALETQLSESYNQLWVPTRSCAHMAPTYYTSAAQVPADAWPIFLVHTTAETGFFHCCGHTYGSWSPSTLSPYAAVADDGNADPSLTPDNWSSAISHEALEMLASPALDGHKLATGAPIGVGGDVYYSYEIADPLFGHNYFAVDPVSGARWRVADFVLPSWYTVGSPGPWDAMGALSGPLRTDGDALSAIRYYTFIDSRGVGGCSITAPPNVEPCKYPTTFSSSPVSTGSVAWRRTKAHIKHVKTTRKRR